MSVLGSGIMHKSGYVSLIGDRKENQDSLMILDDLNLFSIGIFDGHGPSGELASLECSISIKQCLKRFVSKDVETFNKNDQIGSLVDAVCFAVSCANDRILGHGKELGVDMGTTCILACIDSSNKILVASVGDSSAILVRNGGKEVIELNRSHRTDVNNNWRFDEQMRVLRNGGKFVLRNQGRTMRVIPGNGFSEESLKSSRLALNMTRALGHITLGNYGISSSPEITIGPSIQEGDVLIMFSDGVSDVMVMDEAAEIVYNSYKQNQTDPAQAAFRLASESLQRRMNSDNTTVICSFFT